MIGLPERKSTAERAAGRCSCYLLSIFAVLFTASVRPVGGADFKYGKIEIIRDTWGIPHIFSDTDPGAMYGLGYATAEQRGFQMTYALRIIQGRLAEIVGARPHNSRQETAVDNDRKMRTFGWVRAAARVAANLDAGTLGLLRAYCQGVNDSFAEQVKSRSPHPLFQKLGMQPEEWTPADCLLSWWHLGQYFATDGTRDLIAWRNRTNPAPGQPDAPRPADRWHDDSTAVVQRDDVSDDWLRRVAAFLAKNDVPADSPYRASTMKLWGEARLHPAPLSRPAVERLAAERKVLSPGSPARK